MKNGYNPNNYAQPPQDHWLVALVKVGSWILGGVIVVWTVGSFVMGVH